MVTKRSREVGNQLYGHLMSARSRAVSLSATNVPRQKSEEIRGFPKGVDSGRCVRRVVVDFRTTVVEGRNRGLCGVES